MPRSGRLEENGFPKFQSDAGAPDLDRSRHMPSDTALEIDS